jgi:hypothetical protein
VKRKPTKPLDFLRVSNATLIRIADNPDNGCPVEEASIAYELWHARRRLKTLEAEAPAIEGHPMSPEEKRQLNEYWLNHPETR